MQGEIKVSNKNVLLRTILLIILIVLAISAFSLAIVSSSKKYPGYYEINAKIDEEYPGYNADVSTVLYFDNQNGTIKNKKIEAENTYTELLKDVVLRYSPYYNSSYYRGLYYLNNHLNEDVELDSSLYNDLKDAYSKTLENKNYSIFAAPLLNVWNDIIETNNSLGNTSLDPTNNSSYEQTINELVSIINDKTNFNISFNDDTKTCKLSISDSYSQYRISKGITSPIIGFNVLEDAYIARALRNKLHSYGYDNGYINCKDVALLFSEDEQETIITNDENINTLYVNVKGNSHISYIDKTDSASSYKMCSNSDTNLRSNYLNLSNGYTDQFNIKIEIIGSDVVENKYLANYLQTLSNFDDIKAEINKTNGIDVFVLNKDENKKYYYKKGEYVSEYKTYSQDYSIIEIN